MGSYSTGVFPSSLKSNFTFLSRQKSLQGHPSPSFAASPQRACRAPEQIWFRKRGEANNAALLPILHAALSFPQDIRVFSRDSDKAQKIGTLCGWSLVLLLRCAPSP